MVLLCVIASQFTVKVEIASHMHELENCVGRALQKQLLLAPKYFTRFKMLTSRAEVLTKPQM